MKGMEQQELDACREELTADLAELFDKYRAIFCWDIPEIDQRAADRLILAAMKKALDDIAGQS